ncbi:sce7726 family protein [Pasteurellaceae bacterium 20609_3]|uniref:sce7726 family protein n=1 Tax=Spirabiliibacterium mucosae TaxID=28156 RepID=UPI001AADEA87|nr:sce7726 family protein [Spirabiliibacterium mucosae]MBE2898111.1 sce7726 family protein [Spirabiliibacterium mucosae]
MCKKVDIQDLLTMNEIEIRERLIKKLSKIHPKNTEFLAELPIANFSRRIDLVMANGKLSGFEIKSEQDTLKRLEGQIEVYTQYFEDVVVVCATKHLQGVMNITPQNVGIWEFTGKKFITHRSPLTNGRLESEKFLSFLNVVGLKQLLRKIILK